MIRTNAKVGVCGDVPNGVSIGNWNATEEYMDAEISIIVWEELASDRVYNERNEDIRF